MTACLEATDERWVSFVVQFAASVLERKKTAATSMRQALQILRSLRGSVDLQKASFHRLWSCAQSQHFNASDVVEAILHQAFDKDVFCEEACCAYLILQLRRSLHQTAGSRDGWWRGEQLSEWLNRAHEHEHSWCVEVILRFALRCSSDHTLLGQDMAAGACPEIDRLQRAWGVEQVDDSMGVVALKVLLQHPKFWQRACRIAQQRAQSLTPGIMLPLHQSVQSLVRKIMSEELTVQDMLRAATLNAWENTLFVELLECDRSPAQVKTKLQGMIEKVRFMQEFEVGTHHLSVVFPGHAKAKDLAEVLRKSFVEAATATQCELVPRVGQLDVPLGKVNENTWKLPAELPSELQWSNDLPQPSFCLVLTAIKTLHLARSEKNRPLQSMLQEVEQAMSSANRRGSDFNLLDTVFLLYHGLEELLQGIAQKWDQEAGLPSQTLSLIERHWSGVAPSTVSRLLEEIQSVSCWTFGDLNEIGGRLEAILRGRKTVEFWKLCDKILSNFAGTLPKKTILEGFSKETRCHMAALKAMHQAFEAAKANQEQTALTTGCLHEVNCATECLRKLLEFLGPGETGFELVLRLVTTMAEVPGLSFMKVLLSSAQKGERLAMRLAELVEGALTQETLDNVERASAVFMPLCVAALAAMDSPIDSNKFGSMVEGEWPKQIQREALGARSQVEIGQLLLNMIQAAHQNQASKLGDFFEGLKSALRQGQVLQQKLEENSDDATAVSNTVHGMVSSGHLELTLSNDAMLFEVAGVFEFNKDQAMITRDVQQLTECSDKASLAVPKGSADADNPTALTQEKVQVFTGCIEGALGLRQELTELIQIGHPYLEDARTFRFPPQGEGLSASTVQDLKETLRWAQDAKHQWRTSLDEARARHAIMSCVPARNITKLARAVLQNEPCAVAPLMSLQFPTKGDFQEDQVLKEAFERCKFLWPGEGAHEQFLEKLVAVLADQVIPPQAMTSFSPLHQIARTYPKKRASDDATTRSRMDRRQNPKFYPKRVLLVQEEVSHEPGNSDLQSTATITVLSLLLPLGIGPSAENLLLCDSTTTRDDVLRFLHRVTHATRLALDTTRQAQVLGVFIHVDCLQADVLELLLCRVDAMQAAVGRRREAESAVGVEVRLAFTVTVGASKTLIETLEKDLCKQQHINLLKLSSIKSFLKEAGAALGCHEVVSSNYAGDGKTHAIRKCDKWDPASHATIIWGGAQTRGQAARALRKAGSARSVHLELHSFEEGGGVDSDTLLMELLLFRSVFDPERSEWTRVASETPIFVKVANSIKIKQGLRSAPLMLLSTPILEMVPGQKQIDANLPFVFGGEDLDPERAASTARDFALAGASLLLGESGQRLVGCEDENGVVFKLMADAQGQGGNFLKILT